LLDDNIKGGIMYYKSMYKMFGSMELALAAYNAGPANVKKYRAVPPFAETRRFVAKITSDYRMYKAHPDATMIAGAKKQTTPSTIAGNAKVIAQTPSKLAPVPMIKIEQSRNLNAELVKELPKEVEVKSQSVAI
jgi:hypothetical protein